MVKRLVRVRSLSLLLVFLAAGTSLPSLDSLLFHGDPAESRGRIHVEQAGGCPDHAGHCVLGRTATGAGAILAAAVEISFEPAGGPIDRLTSQSFLSTDPAGQPNSRAPPVLLV